MKLKCHSFKVTEGTVLRDAEGGFFFHSATGECRKIEREEARQRLRLSQTGTGTNDQFAYPNIGEQSISHTQYFDSGKAFIEVGRDALAMNWESFFKLKMQIAHMTTISYILLHGIELGLKAFLLFMDKRLLPLDLKDYGHDLVKLLTVAKEKGLRIERPIIIPCETDLPAGEEAERDDEEYPGDSNAEPELWWTEDIFGVASQKSERQFDTAIGINFERYKGKGMEYPLSVFLNQEPYFLASIAGLAYALFDRIQKTDGFFDPLHPDRCTDFEEWLKELRAKRQEYGPITIKEAAARANSIIQ